ncbi:hypothetical protein L873DRAFT_1653835, partial [Choiromyces venosus 120613-1]
SDGWCMKFLRFNKSHLCKLTVLLPIPDTFYYCYHTHLVTILRLTVTLYQLLYPSRLEQYISIFG